MKPDRHALRLAGKIAKEAEAIREIREKQAMQESMLNKRNESEVRSGLREADAFENSDKI